MTATDVATESKVDYTLHRIREELGTIISDPSLITLLECWRTRDIARLETVTQFIGNQCDINEHHTARYMERQALLGFAYAIACAISGNRDGVDSNLRIACVNAAVAKARRAYAAAKNEAMQTLTNLIDL